MMPGQSSKKIAGVRRSGPPSKDVFSSPAPAPRGEPLREEDDFPAAPDEDDEQFSTPRGASSKSSVFHSAASAIPSSDLLLAASSDLAEPKKPSPHITLGFSLGRLPSPMDQPARKVSYVDNNLVKQRTVSGSSTHAPTPVEGGSDEFDPVDGTPEPSTGRLSPPSQDSSTTSHRAAALGPPPGLSPTPSHQRGGSRPCVARNSCKRIERTPSIHARAAGDCTRPAPSGTRMRPIASVLCAPPVQRSPEAHTRWQGKVGEGRVGAGVLHAAPRSSDTGVVAAERSAISIVDISAADPITAAAASPVVLRGAHLVAG